MAANRKTSDDFDEVDIMAHLASKKMTYDYTASGAAPVVTAVEKVEPATAESVSALDAFLNDILDLSDGPNALPSHNNRESSDGEAQNVDPTTLTIHEQRRLRRPKDAARMLEIVRKQLADWSRHAGVLGVICVNVDGCVLVTDMEERLAREIAGRFHQLLPMVRRSVSAIDEDDELELIRFRTQNYEILATTDNDYTMLIVSVSTCMQLVTFDYMLYKATIKSFRDRSSSILRACNIIIGFMVANVMRNFSRKTSNNFIDLHHRKWSVPMQSYSLFSFSVMPVSFYIV